MIAIPFCLSTIESMEYYVYRYNREDGSPYYIGKGRDNRAYVKSKRDTVSVPRDLSRVVIVKSGLTESEAYDLERSLIACYGRVDLGTGVLRNLSEGGQGGDMGYRQPKGKYTRTPEQRERQRQAALSKPPMSEESKQKISAASKLRTDRKWHTCLTTGKTIRTDSEIPPEGYRRGRGGLKHNRVGRWTT